ncbi:MAG: sigma-70 family RNA polymerase sigma factor, partial [Chitinophagaceae bacterium]|nr:sigma-70 family RNA polymerase sigma factor [Chitinophagaceae bacterium]
MSFSIPVATQDTFDYQKNLFPYAYNILGSVEDARDAVQDVVVRYLSTPPSEVKNEKNYLIRSVINQAISVKTRNQKITGEKTWLPEPVASESADGMLYKNEILSYSLLVLLEKLNAKERAVFILKEAFDYGHDEISKLLSITEENSRKLLSRAKNKLSDFKKTGTKFSSNSTVAEKYYTLIKNADVQGLEKLLAEEVAITADGGDKVKVVREFLQGKTPVAELLLFAYERFQRPLT